MIPRLQKKYKEECIVKMQEKFGIKNYLAVPKLEKIIEQRYPEFSYH